MLALAGPGTGKTESVTNRVVKLIEDGRANGDADIHKKILVITFTKKAARELLMRISEKLSNVNLGEMYISTFHSFCERIMHENPKLRGDYSRNARILDENEQVFFLQKYITVGWQEENGRKFPQVCGFGKDDTARAASLAAVMDHLGIDDAPSRFQTAQAVCDICDKLLDEMVTPEELRQSSESQIRALGDMLAYYLEILRENDVHVFATLQYTLFTELKKDSGSFADLFRYIIVDEYQDTNLIQNEIVEMIAGKDQNLMVVGDDDQSIYRFRGAVVENILGFEEKHKGCEEVILDRNFRSTQEIVSFYTRWMHTIDWNGRRYEKDLQVENGSVEGSVCCIRGMNQKSWMEELYGFIAKLKGSGRITDYNQIVYLCNSVANKRIVELQDFLKGKGIPVYSPRSKKFFQRDEIRLAVGCLLLILQVRFNQKYNPLPADAQQYAASCLNDYPDLKRTIGALQKTLAGERKFSALLYRLFACEPFRGWLNEDIGGSWEKLRAARNLAALSHMLVSYENENIVSSLEKGKGRFIHDYLFPMTEKGAGEYEDEQMILPCGCVTFMTYHQAKGLEFPIVIVDLPNYCYRDEDSDVVSRYIARRRNTDGQAADAVLYDLMRKYYTAFSRARNLLALSCIKPDVIFDDIIEDVPQWRDVWQKIEAMRFDTVKDAETVDSFAFTSDIENYEKCPLRYKFYRMLDFAPTMDYTSKTLLGTLVHQTIEELNRCAMEGGTPDEGLIDGLLSENTESLGKAYHCRFSAKERDIARGHIRNYYRYVESHFGKRNPKLKWHNIEGAEKEVSLPKTVDGKRYYMKGSVDLIRGYEKYYTIIDFKTGQKTPEKTKEYRRQLRIYASLLRGLADGRETTMQLFFTAEKEPLDTIRYDEEERAGRIAAEEKIFAQTVLKIINRDDQDFTADPKNENVCKSCDFRFYCGKGS